MKLNLHLSDSHTHIPIPKNRDSNFLVISLSLIFVLINAYLLYHPEPKSISNQVLKVGDIVSEDIIIKKDLNLEDKESTQENINKAESNIVPIYELNSEKWSEVDKRLEDWIGFLRESRVNFYNQKSQISRIKEDVQKNFGLNLSESFLTSVFKSNILSRINLDAIEHFLKEIYEKKIIDSKISARKSAQGTIKLISKYQEPLVVSFDQLSDLSMIDNELTIFLSRSSFSKKEMEWSIPLFIEFISPNITFSINLTQEEEKKATAQVNPSLIRLKAGKVLLRKGDEIKPEDLKILRLIALEEKKEEKSISQIYLIMGILIFFALFGRKFVKIWKVSGVNREKFLIVMGVTLTISALVYRICLFLFPIILNNLPVHFRYDTFSIHFAIPFAFGGLIFSFLFDFQSAIVFSFINSIFAGIICDWDLKIFLYALIGNTAVSYGIEYFQRLKRSPIFKASLTFLLGINLSFILLELIFEPEIRSSLIVNLTMGLISAAGTSVLASIIIPFWEMIFKLISELKLVELTNLNLPIFREMLEKAPGTYHHSQMVASLAETAAQAVGVSPILLTSMALYHDIGKIDNPEIFTENHAMYHNPHENMSPTESAKSIITHIPNGLERATKLKLPEFIKSSINQHHGTKVVRFFYEKALDLSTVNVDEIDDKNFRYQGDRPKNIENAIIMLADQVEAASKSFASPSDEDIKNVVEKIIASNIEEDQFTDCEGLTFMALNTIASSFQKKLTSIYHMRVSYPGFNFKGKNGNGRNHH